MLFDTHAHYDDAKFEKDRSEVIDRAHKSGVGYILNASSNIATSVESISLAQRHDFVYAAVGVHPHYANEISNNKISTLADFAKNEKVVAIGEIGLDYYYDNSPRELQRHWFSKQINLARNINLPVIVHNRDAHEDVLNIIRSEDAKTVGGVFHCYSGSVEMAKELLRHNFYISVGGPVTFKKAKTIIEVVKFLPNDRLLLETDCPYMAPEPHRGKRNDSGYLRFIAEKIAEIKGITVEEVEEITTRNARELFKIN